MPQTLYIAGDSTAAAKDASQKPMAGWGEYLHHFVTPSLRIDNRAVNGRSTKSFLEEGRWAAIEGKLRDGDIAMIQFGHNDEKKGRPFALHGSRYRLPQQFNAVHRFGQPARSHAGFAHFRQPAAFCRRRPSRSAGGRPLSGRHAGGCGGNRDAAA